MRYCLRNLFSISNSIGLIIFLLALGSLVYAQRGSSRSIANSPLGPFADSLERRSREVALRSVAMTGSSKEPDRRVNRALFEQMNEDFKQIQIIRLGMVHNIQDGKLFEYKSLSDNAAEIRKRATRLKASLALFDQRESDQQPFEKVEFDKEKIQDAASELCLEVSQFIENPMFKSGGAYNIRDAAEAEQTLDTVIHLSTNIKNSADKLRKAN